MNKKILTYNLVVSAVEVMVVDVIENVVVLKVVTVVMVVDMVIMMVQLNSVVYQTNLNHEQNFDDDNIW